MATVRRRRRKQADGTYSNEGWQVRWVDPEGHERLRVFRLKDDADRHAIEIEHAKLTGRYIDPQAGKVTFKAYTEQWRQAQPHRESTANQLASKLNVHIYPTLGDRPLASIRPTEVQALIKAKTGEMAPATLVNLATWVRTIFRAAVADRLIVASPAANLRLPAEEEREPVVPLELAEVAAIREALPVKVRAIVDVGVGLGLRSGEALGLSVDRVDFLRRAVTVDRQAVTPMSGTVVFGPPKTKRSRRVIPLPDTIGTALSAHIAGHGTGPDGLLFTTPRGLMWRRQRFAEIWQTAVGEAGLPKGTRFHLLRHTYASLLIGAGCSVKVVQDRLGHATAAETLDTYSHLWPGDDDRTRQAVDAAFEPGSDQDRTNLSE